VLRRVSNNAVASTRQVTGASTSTIYNGLSDFGLTGDLGTVDFQVEIRSYLATTPAWQSTDLRIYTFVRVVVAVIVGASVTCTT